MLKKQYRIEFIIKVDQDITDEQVNEWARFMVGDTGKMSTENPLYDDVSFDPVYGTFKLTRTEQ